MIKIIIIFGMINKYYLNILASAVKPEMLIPICLSIGMIFF